MGECLLRMDRRAALASEFLIFKLKSIVILLMRRVVGVTDASDFECIRGKPPWS
jgi:hypothetical protein